MSGWGHDQQEPIRMTRGDIISTMRQSIATDQAAALNRNDETTPLSFLAVLTFALSLTMRSYSLVVLRKQLLGGDDFITFSTLTARHAPGGIRHRHVGGRYAAALGGGALLAANPDSARLDVSLVPWGPQIF